MEDRPPYDTGHAAAPEPPPLTTEDLVTQAHAHRQGIPYDRGDRLLRKLPERMRALCDQVLSGKARTGDVAYALAALIDSIENAPTGAGLRPH